MANVSVIVLDSFHLNGVGMIHAGQKGVEIEEVLAKKLVKKGLIQITGTAVKRRAADAKKRTITNLTGEDEDGEEQEEEEDPEEEEEEEDETPPPSKKSIKGAPENKAVKPASNKKK